MVYPSHETSNTSILAKLVSHPSKQTNKLTSRQDLNESSKVNWGYTLGLHYLSKSEKNANAID